MTPFGNEYFDIIIVEPDIAKSEVRDVVDMIVDFVNDATAQSLFEVRELPKVARWSYWTDYYACQLDNGGHCQFLYNCGQDPDILADISTGLAAIGANSYLKIFNDLTVFLASDPVRANALRQSDYSDNIDPVISALDRRYEDLGNHMLVRDNAEMVRAYRALQPTPRSERRAAFERLTKLNPRHTERRVAVDAKTAKRDATPMGITARAIAEAAGLKLRSWLRGNPPQLSIIAIDTETGPFLIKLDQAEALIYSKNGELPWAYFDVKKPGTLIACVPLHNGLPSH